MCTKVSTMTCRIYKLKIKAKPIATSQTASKTILTVGETKPNVSILIVSFANISAGLRPGKNFKIPNHK